MTASESGVPTLGGDEFRQQTPKEMIFFVHKLVEVESIDGKIHTGWVHTIDPVSKSIVLVQFSEDTSNECTVVMGHAVKTVRISSDATEHEDELERLFSRETKITFTKEEIQRRKIDLKDWLEKNRLPVTMSGDQEELLSVSDALFIQPPYTSDNCISTNEIILGRIQALIKLKPKT
ncbi:gem-associated protein 6-like [Saccoglossus kowalevskii]|uniref:Gem-associated protein 6-like n=1 Tax=Saccoglossus kowalevskii TaxID=10224 RepID=A0ABM0GY41_SACKO|nr:PREDICTED: gem-associated protein 6-like [Saccoglossus kowalevskii]